MSIAVAKTEQAGNTVRRRLALYLGFVCAGIGVALPGVLLPSLLSSWHLTDEQAGRLFLNAWLGSAAGALLVRGALQRVLQIGAVATAAGVSALAAFGGHGAFGWMFLYGLGLGLTMTSISLIRQHDTGPDSGTELVRLNLLWAIGACACPSLAAHSLKTGTFQPVLWLVGAVFLALALWASIHRDVSFKADRITDVRLWQVFRRVPAGLILITMCITGVEASAGGWLTTYAQREGHHLIAIVAAPTCFWAGLVCSRCVWSLRCAPYMQARIVRGSLVLMLCASTILFTATGSVSALLGSAFLLGFGIGPVYPLMLACALRFYRGGAIFFLAGVGSASLPWAMGLVSTRWHSLHAGFAIPLAGSALMLVTSLTTQLHSGADRELQP